MNLIYRTSSLLLVWLPAVAWSATVEDEAEGLSGEAELGLVNTSGNTDTSSVHGKGKLLYLSVPWRNELKAEALQKTDSGVTTAERYQLAGKSDYRFTAHDYWFLSFRYVDDRFSGYDYQFSETLGYGRRVVDKEALKLDLELGFGGRHSQETGAERTDEGIARGAAKLAWHISPSAHFREDVLVESGKSNTQTEAVSALKLRINSSFAMKLSYSIKHNSTVPPGVEHTDTITAVTLVYDF